MRRKELVIGILCWIGWIVLFSYAATSYPRTAELPLWIPVIFIPLVLGSIFFTMAGFGDSPVSVQLSTNGEKK